MTWQCNHNQSAIVLRCLPIPYKRKVFVFCSIVQNVYAPEEDPEMTVEIYERSDEQNDLLGITDMKTEDYVTNTNWSKQNIAKSCYAHI